ncbi:MAG: aspartate-semialdehyde dehydrogenase [Deltaproteobacteria bacterium]|nr:aspartate-semialdehyde dehydrogenase [Deltaproteobacteria bacterium]MBW2628759.1 aspartate-semialdehyde dehydrogenase [Deltaproteobacteria bacterium]
MAQGLKVAVVGATGMVGAEMLRVLEQRAFPVAELVPVASARSAGKTVTFNGAEHTVVEIAPEVFEGVDLALFSAGGGTSREWAPIAASKGALVVDNSSAFRSDPEVPLIVPEVNPEAAADRPKGIIANPNCSTIQMVVALKPLHDEARLKRVVVATYQAISGSGATAVAAFEAQEQAIARGGEVDKDKLSGQLSRNLLMHWKPDPETGYQEEELKMVSETRKIFGDPAIAVSPTAVRVPVVTAHSEAITVETHAPITAERARELLSQAEGIEVVDDLSQGIYPQPIDAAGQDPVYVGRIREDVGNPGGIQMWVVSDNLRKGAALNAVQIAETVLLK